MKTDLEKTQDWLDNQIKELSKIEKPDTAHHYYHQHKENFPEKYMKLKREWDEAQMKIKNFKEVLEQILFYQCDGKN